MKRIHRIPAFFMLLFVILFSQKVMSQSDWRLNEMQIKAVIPNPETIKVLTEFNIQGDMYLEQGYGIFYVIPAEREIFDSLNISYNIMIGDLRNYYKNFWLQTESKEVPSGYHSYADILALVDSLVNAFPDICKKISYGTSSGGKELFALKISEGVANHKNRPQIMFDAGIHGNEVMGPEICLMLARELCVNYATNSTFADYINSREIWFYFMVNPDGRTNMVRYNVAGYDCNRNFGFLWDNQCLTGAPNSQPETKAIYQCILENPFVTHITYHAGTTMISYPWSYRGDLCPDNDVIDTIAKLYVNNSGYIC